MRIDTGWLDREGTRGAGRRAAGRPADAAAGGTGDGGAEPRPAGPPPLPGTDWTSPWHRRDAWRLNQAPHGLVRLLDGEALHIVTVEGTGERFTARLGVDELHARCGVADGRVWVESDGWRRSFPAAIVGHTLTLDHRRAGGARLTLEDGRFAARGEEEDLGLFTAPMPGKVTKLLVAVGDRVRKGQALAVLEAMKMESRFEAPRDGLVTAVHVREGDQVEEGAVLLDLKPEEAAA